MFDPEKGHSRRVQARDQLLSRARHARRDLDKRTRYATGTASGRFKRLAHSGEHQPLPNEAALAAKVESVIFRPEDAPKGRVSVNVEDHIVVLRGEVEQQEQIDTLVRTAEHVDGVDAVRNLMHLPGEPVPS
jgi:osmotically-inducible protein OsmY